MKKIEPKLKEVHDSRRELGVILGKAGDRRTAARSVLQDTQSAMGRAPL